MNIQLLILFIVLNVVNVILQTIKSLATVKCGKCMAALINALAYGLYTVVLVYTVCELPLFVKAGVVAVCNLIGVFIVKWLEEKVQKDKLWKVEMTVPKGEQVALMNEFDRNDISFNSTTSYKWAMFNCYCPTKQESHIVREIGKKHGAKFFVTESKVL